MGYWRIWNGGNRDYAHRLVYMWEHHLDCIPKGMQVHHKCENKACLNVDHMVLLSEFEHKSLHMTGLDTSKENDAHSTLILQTNLKTGEVTEWPSMMEAQRAGYNQPAISAVCSGKRKSHSRCSWVKA